MVEEEMIIMDEASTSSTKAIQQQDVSIDLAHVDIVTYAPGFDPWIEPCVGVESVVEHSVFVNPMKKKQTDSGYSEGSCGDFEISDYHDQADFNDSPGDNSDMIVEVSSSFLTEVANCQENEQNIPSCLAEAINRVARDSVAEAADDRNVGNSVEIIEDVAEDCDRIADELANSVEIIGELNNADYGRQDAGDNVSNANADSAVSVKDEFESEDDPYVIYRELKSGKINTSRDNII